MANEVNIICHYDAFAGLDSEFRLSKSLEETSQGLHVITPTLRVDKNVVPVKKNIIQVSNDTIHSSLKVDPLFTKSNGILRNSQCHKDSLRDVFLKNFDLPISLDQINF